MSQANKQEQSGLKRKSDHLWNASNSVKFPLELECHCDQNFIMIRI